MGIVQHRSGGREIRRQRHDQALPHRIFEPYFDMQPKRSGSGDR
jgi:hypothetical protein